MPSRHDEMKRKHRLLEQRDSEYAAKLARAFTSPLAAAIRASGPNERQRALEAAVQAYEDALDDALGGDEARSSGLSAGTIE